MILKDAKDVSGHAGVFATVSGLCYTNLYSPVVVHFVHVSIQGARPTVFEPETEKQQL